MSSLAKEVLQKQLNRSTPRPLSNKPRIAINSKYKKNYTPLSYKGYFTEARDLITENGDSFRVYLSGFNNPSVEVPILLLLHGGGYSALTWSLFTKELTELSVCKIAAIDLRGHGSTITSNDEDLSIDTLCNDVGNVFKALTCSFKLENSFSVILVGHSMGGALAIHCSNKLQEIMSNIIGLIVIDVVEGTALEALHSMQSFLKARPKCFPNLENAIEWSIRSGQTKNVEASRVSMPGQLKSCLTNKLSVDSINDSNLSNSQDSFLHLSSVKTSLQNFTLADQILEETEETFQSDSRNLELTKMESSSESEAKNETVQETFCWRIDLSKTEPYWKGWFQGLSNLFLNSPAQAKLLLLAGVDRLDKALTIGQMQGKFQMQVLPQCGHAVHEDVPDKVAEAIATFLVRNRFTIALKEIDRPFPSC